MQPLHNIHVILVTLKVVLHFMKKVCFHNMTMSFCVVFFSLPLFHTVYLSIINYILQEILKSDNVQGPENVKNGENLFDH